MSKTVLLAVTGSISAYKAADIVSHLVKLGYTVEVLMSESAQSFITPLTLQVLSRNLVHLDTMAEPAVDKVNHIELAKKADLFLVAPASANIIGKFANGIADDLISTVALALPDSTPKILAPAMNTQMYANRIFQRNLNVLKEFDWEEIEPRVALLACQDLGKGALAQVDLIIETVHGKLSSMIL